MAIPPERSEAAGSVALATMVVKHEVLGVSKCVEEEEEKEKQEICCGWQQTGAR